MSGTSEEPLSRFATAPLSRRAFLRSGVAAVAADAVLGRSTEAAEPAAAGAGPDPAALNTVIAGELKVTLRINGQDRPVTVEPRTTLLSALRDRLDPAVTGPKLVCDAGTCGACTVLLNGKPVYGCSVLAIDAAGKPVTTVEGLGTPDHPNAVQAAFVEHDAMMCGFCTSGFVTTLSALLRDTPHPTETQVREACKGNFCRCGTYPHVVKAALAAAQTAVQSPK
jgi:xanthine dehydrogenase YagT iron-sulfur-binding subunit